MRAAVYHGAGELRVTEMPEPVRGPGDLLVRVSACGLCGSDITAWYQDPRAPMVMGHEPVGVVVDADPGAATPVGTRVFVHHHVPCMTCELCRAGRHTLCPRFAATRIDPGGLAEVVRVPAENARLDVLELPPHLTDEEATFIEPLACVVRGLRAAGVGPGTSVAVVGAGAMGLLEVQAAMALGAPRVLVAEPRADRLARAVALGAAPAVPGERAQVVVVTTSSAAAIAAGLELAGPGAVLQLFAPPRPRPPGAGGPGRRVDARGVHHAQLHLGGPVRRAGQDMALRAVPVGLRGDALPAGPRPATHVPHHLPPIRNATCQMVALRPRAVRYPPAVRATPGSR
ncbi:MAG: alcohol dehydrogenase catalytic domain-containing protein [Thermoleophilia bacterium]